MQSEVLLTGDQFYRYQLKDIKVFSIQIAEHSWLLWHLCQMYNPFFCLFLTRVSWKRRKKKSARNWCL